jgi:hypothetical protein
MLKQEAPFLKTIEDFIPLPFDSTVFKSITVSVFLPHEIGSSLCLTVTSHLQLLSQKIANQNDLHIKDNWCSLYQTIFNVINNDKDFLADVYMMQQEFYQAPLKVWQDNDRAE